MLSQLKRRQLAGQGLWQHGMIELLLSILIYLVFISYKKNGETNVRNIILMGIFSILLIFCRPMDFMLTLPVIYYILSLKNIKKLLYYLISSVLASIPFIVYNEYFFHNIGGLYVQSTLGSAPGIINSATNSGTNSVNYITIFINYITNYVGYITNSVYYISNSVNTYFVNGFLGLTISPGKGLFIFSPILIFSLIGMWVVIGKKGNVKIRNFMIISLVSILLNVTLYSSFQYWTAGYCYGPRYLTDILPIMAVFLCIALEYICTIKMNGIKHIIYAIIVLFLVWSIFVQIVGVVFYPSSWDASPTSIDISQDRVWNIRDTQIGRSFSEGIFHISSSYISYNTLSGNAYPAELIGMYLPNRSNVGMQ